jgi:hypothetical protein
MKNGVMEGWSNGEEENGMLEEWNDGRPDSLLLWFGQYSTIPVFHHSRLWVSL